MKNDMNNGVKDSLLYEFAPILAKHFGHIIDSETAYNMACKVVQLIENEISTIATSRRE